MQFGRRAGSQVEQSVKRSVSGGSITNLRDGKDLRVHFLQDPEDWHEYFEHYSDEAKFFPCTGDRDTCPGCTSASEKTQSASKRYLANVLDVNQGRVIIIKMPVDLADRLLNKRARNGGTLLDRDWTLIRIGKGFDTKYDVETEDKVALDLAAYEKKDFEQALKEQFAGAFGEDYFSKPNGSAAPQERVPENDPAPF